MNTFILRNADMEKEKNTQMQNMQDIMVKIIRPQGDTITITQNNSHERTKFTNHPCSFDSWIDK